MQDEHGFVWQAMLNTIEMDLAGTRVLDAGCNRGGFLRLLVDTVGIAEGWGYDPAADAVADAVRLAGERPLTFGAGHTVPDGWGGFDVAFSHEVLYLLPDLAGHAKALFGALRPGGSYFAVMGVHAESELMIGWHEEKSAELNLPPLYRLDAVVEIFVGEGFEASVANLRLGFIPVSAHRYSDDHRRDLLAWVNYYTRDKVLLRFDRPLS
jgi:SAM-dependent methyltransferase